MFRILRRLVLSFVAIASVSQTAQPQALACDRTAMAAPLHEGHSSSGADAVQGSDDSSPESSECVVTARCINAPAIVVTPDAHSQEISTPADLPEALRAAPRRDVRPDLPPPRL